MAAGMNLAALGALLLIFVGGQIVESISAGSMILMDSDAPLKKCRYSISYDMKQVTCKDLGLDNIPSNLQANIEVLDARVNRIRHLHNNSLSRYSSLRYLYLQDNFVQIIEEGAFGPTYYLEVLDLSKNGLLKVPKSIFYLNSLRNLYLIDNHLEDSQFEVLDVKAPLQWVHLAGNSLTKMPRLVPIPMVTVLNISRNHISKISTDDIAALCSLQVLDLTGNPIKFDENSCDCYVFKDWAKFRKINVKMNVDCPKSQLERCSIGLIDVEPENRFSNLTMNLYGGCVTSLKKWNEAKKARTTWTWVASCVGAFIFCICIGLCCMHKRNKNKRQRLKEQNILNAANNANTEQLLNKDPNHEQS